MQRRNKRRIIRKQPSSNTTSATPENKETGKSINFYQEQYQDLQKTYLTVGSRSLIQPGTRSHEEENYFKLKEIERKASTMMAEVEKLQPYIEVCSFLYAKLLLLTAHLSDILGNALQITMYKHFFILLNENSPKTFFSDKEFEDGVCYAHDRYWEILEEAKSISTSTDFLTQKAKMAEIMMPSTSINQNIKTMLSQMPSLIDEFSNPLIKFKLKLKKILLDYEENNKLSTSLESLHDTYQQILNRKGNFSTREAPRTIEKIYLFEIASNMFRIAVLNRTNTSQNISQVSKKPNFFNGIKQFIGDWHKIKEAYVIPLISILKNKFNDNMEEIRNNVQLKSSLHTAILNLDKISKYCLVLSDIIKKIPEEETVRLASEDTLSLLDISNLNKKLLENLLNYFPKGILGAELSPIDCAIIEESERIQRLIEEKKQDRSDAILAISEKNKKSLIAEEDKKEAIREKIKEEKIKKSIPKDRSESSSSSSSEEDHSISETARTEILNENDQALEALQKSELTIIELSNKLIKSLDAFLAILERRLKSKYGLPQNKIAEFNFHLEQIILQDQWIEELREEYNTDISSNAAIQNNKQLQPGIIWGQKNILDKHEIIAEKLKLCVTNKVELEKASKESKKAKKMSLGTDFYANKNIDPSTLPKKVIKKIGNSEYIMLAKLKEAMGIYTVSNFTLEANALAESQQALDYLSAMSDRYNAAQEVSDEKKLLNQLYAANVHYKRYMQTDNLTYLKHALRRYQKLESLLTNKDNQYRAVMNYNIGMCYYELYFKFSEPNITAADALIYFKLAKENFNNINDQIMIKHTSDRIEELSEDKQPKVDFKL